MKLFVERKMVESKDRILYNWDAKEAESRLAEVLFEDDPGILEDAGVCVD